MVHKAGYLNQQLMQKVYFNMEYHVAYILLLSMLCSVAGVQQVVGKLGYKV